MSMANAIRFYMDDSGSRHPDRKPAESAPEHDWFALGGVLIDESRLQEAENSVDAFNARWPRIAGAPLHSSCIRSRTGAFRWLIDASASDKDAFMGDLTSLMTRLPIVVLACVVDRPGYNRRYKDLYGQERWSLCRTAFSIAVERAAKYSIAQGKRLRVHVEQSDRKTEARLKGYYEHLRSKGAPFRQGTSAKYGPLEPADLAQALLEFRIKSKASRLMQVADLALWPVCKGGYVPELKPYVALREAGKLLDLHCTEANGLHGIKYSCFDTETDTVEKQKPAEAGSWAATDTTGG